MTETLTQVMDVELNALLKIYGDALANQTVFHGYASMNHAEMEVLKVLNNASLPILITAILNVNMKHKGTVILMKMKVWLRE